MLICILCGNADYDSIHETDDDQEYYCNAMRMRYLTPLIKGFFILYFF